MMVPEIPQPDPAVDITVVVVTYNRAAMLPEVIASLAHQETRGEFSYEILVVDDGSTDGTAETIRRVAQEGVPVVVNYVYQEHGGEGDARNKGVEQARGAWIAFCDDDQLAHPKWLAELYGAARQQKIKCVGGAVRLDLPPSAHLFLGRRCRRFLGELDYGHQVKPSKLKNTIGGGNVLLHRSLFDQVGPFDTTFRQGVDTDFFWRLEKAGVKVSYAPEAWVSHVIPEYRAQVPYLREVCLRTGVANARIRLKYDGPLKLFRAICWRVGVALGRDLPLILISRIFNAPLWLLDGKCGFWYTLGFVRGSLYWLAPSLFPQRKFISGLDFLYRRGNWGA